MSTCLCAGVWELRLVEGPTRPQQVPLACLPHSHLFPAYLPCLSQPQPLSAHPWWLPGHGLVAPSHTSVLPATQTHTASALLAQDAPLPGSPLQSPGAGGACNPQVTAPPRRTCSLPTGPGWDTPRAETGSFHVPTLGTGGGIIRLLNLPNHVFIKHILSTYQRQAWCWAWKRDMC